MQFNISNVVYGIIMALILLVPAQVFASTSFDRTTVFVVDGNGGFVHDLNLKATEMGNGQVIPVSNFEIEPEDVVQVKQGGNFMVFTGASEDVVEKVKVTPVPVLGVTTELVNVGGQSYTTQGLATGVYTLDIIINTGGNEREAFQTILVVLGVNESPVNPITIINNYQNIIETRTIIKFNGDSDDDKDKKTKDGGSETKKPEGRDCTTGMDAASLACREGITVEQYCAKNPQTPGCPEEPEPIEGCQPEDDFCEPGCESPTVDCIDDVNVGDDGEDSVSDEDAPAEEEDDVVTEEESEEEESEEDSDEEEEESEEEENEEDNSSEDEEPLYG